MTYLRAASLVLGVSFLIFSCGGDIVNSRDGTGGNSSGMPSGGGSGDGGGPNAGSGGGMSLTACSRDEDCAAGALTNRSCYSSSCSLPVGVSRDEMDADPCIVEWTGMMGPDVPDGCAAQDDEIACPDICAPSPTCILPYCSAGECKLSMQQDGSECEVPNGAGGTGNAARCAELDDARSAALERARQCLVGGIIPECDGGVWIPDDCDCPVLVNDKQEEWVADARAAYQAWNEECEFPERCLAVDCGASGAGGECKAELGGDFDRPGVCSW